MPVMTIFANGPWLIGSIVIVPKGSVPYRNFLDCGDLFLFWPADPVIYLLLSAIVQARGMQLTLEQKASLHMQERAEAEKKDVLRRTGQP
jgi:hypothetical protein